MLRIIGSSGFRVGRRFRIFSDSRVKIESAAVEIDRQLDPLAVTEAAGRVLEPLNPCVELFRRGIGGDVVR